MNLSSVSLFFQPFTELLAYFKLTIPAVSNVNFPMLLNESEQCCEICYNKGKPTCPLITRKAMNLIPQAYQRKRVLKTKTSILYQLNLILQAGKK